MSVAWLSTLSGSAMPPPQSSAEPACLVGEGAGGGSVGCVAAAAAGGSPKQSGTKEHASALHGYPYARLASLMMTRMVRGMVE